MKQKNNMEHLARKIAKNKKDLQLSKARKLKKIKIGVIVALFILLVALLTVLIDRTVEFFRENTIVKHKIVEMKFNKPLEIVSLAELHRREVYEQTIADIANRVIDEYQKPLDSVKMTDKGCQITTQINPKTFFDIIAVKESGNNKNDNPKALHNFCKAKGMYNAIGYSPTTKFCFKDEQEARLFVAYYVKKNCDGKTMESCQCYWNTGTWQDSCAYSEGDLSMAN